MSMAQEDDHPYFEEEVGAWHLHTFLFEFKESSVNEALRFRLVTKIISMHILFFMYIKIKMFFRRKLREMINDGRLAECSLNQVCK